jgi:hypothetical protein
MKHRLRPTGMAYEGLTSGGRSGRRCSCDRLGSPSSTTVVVVVVVVDGGDDDLDNNDDDDYDNENDSDPEADPALLACTSCRLDGLFSVPKAADEIRSKT